MRLCGGKGVARSVDLDVAQLHDPGGLGVFLLHELAVFRRRAANGIHGLLRHEFLDLLAAQCARVLAMHGVDQRRLDGVKLTAAGFLSDSARFSAIANSFAKASPFCKILERFVSIFTNCGIGASYMCIAILMVSRCFKRHS